MIGNILAKFEKIYRADFFQGNYRALSFGKGKIPGIFQEFPGLYKLMKAVTNKSSAQIHSQCTRRNTNVRTVKFAIKHHAILEVLFNVAYMYHV